LGGKEKTVKLPISSVLRQGTPGKQERAEEQLCGESACKKVWCSETEEAPRVTRKGRFGGSVRKRNEGSTPREGAELTGEYRREERRYDPNSKGVVKCKAWGLKPED